MFKKVILKTSVAALLFASSSLTANAHEVWLERDLDGPVRVYVGPAEGPYPDHGKEVDKIKSAKVFKSDMNHTFPLKQEHDHMTVMGARKGDLRLFTDQVWKPWKTKDGSYQAAIMLARVGRTETISKLDLEIVPIKSGSNSFTVVYKGKPLANNEIMVVSPDQWVKHIETNKAGVLTIPMIEKGRYILVSHHDVEGENTVAGQKVSKTSYVSTLTFTAQ